MSSPQAVEKPSSRLAVFGAVSFYLVAALAMILGNKWVLIKSTTPLFFLLCQVEISVILLLLCRVFRILRFSIIPSWNVIKGLAPLIVINVMGLSFNNFTLKYVDASFYQIARGLLVPFTVVTSFIFLNSRPSLLVLLACGIVTSGFLVGVLLDKASSSDTVNTSLVGIIFGLVSTMTTAMHAVVIKRSLPVVNGDTIELAWYSNFISSFLLAPLVYIAGEAPGVYDLFIQEEAPLEEGQWNNWRTFVWGTAVTGLFGFLICIAGFLSIKVTSPVTHMISSAVRGVFQSLLGMWLFHEIITAGRGASIGVILVGSIYYSYVKNEELIAKTKAANASEATYERVPLEDVEEKKPTTTESTA